MEQPLSGTHKHYCSEHERIFNLVDQKHVMKLSKSYSVILALKHDLPFSSYIFDFQAL